MRRRSHPPVGGHAGLRACQPDWTTVERVEAQPADWFAELSTGDVNARGGDDVAVAGIGRERPIDCLEVGSRHAAGTGRGRVEAPDVLQRPIPELELPDGVRRDLLAEVNRARVRPDGAVE